METALKTDTEMTMVERLRFLCKERGTNFKQLEKHLGMGNGTIAKSTETMRCDRLKAIADYFGVSMEYLMGEDGAAAPALPPDLTAAALEVASAFDRAEEAIQYAVCKLLSLAFKKDTALMYA